MTDSSYRMDDLIFALATPRGRSAIAVIRTSGEGSIQAVSGYFSRPDDLINSEGYRVVFGWLTDSDGSRIDQVLITVFRKPASYTGQESVEISCHGGPVIVDRVMNLLRGAGFRDAEPGEFSFRAFGNGKMDLTQAEAVREIIDARTDRARALAISRLGGSVRAVIDDVKANVRRQAAVAALALDYPDDEGESADFDLAAIDECRGSLERLIGSWSTGKLYRDGLTVAFAGPANAGKSSLFNLFLKEERSIVTETPGTTRDWLESWVSLEGIPLRLIDTAGLRSHSSDPIEREGMRRSRELLANADLVIVVADGSMGEAAATSLERDEIALTSRRSAGESHHIIRVWNKADLVPESPPGWLPVSAVTGSGFQSLETAIKTFALAGGTSPESDAPVIDSMRQKRLLEAALAALDRFSQGAKPHGAAHVRGPQLPVDLLAEDLRDALDALGELTGAVTRADILETLFSDFCVGK